MSKTPSNTIGRNIRQLRQKENWSQAMVAKKLDLSIPAFSKIETGLTDCSWTRLEQIADLFKVHVMDIVLEPGKYAGMDQAEEIDRLNELVESQGQEIIKLQKRTIGLYEELAREKVLPD
jgi:transcriptional regulator with XRE-family HTH domain